MMNERAHTPGVGMGPTPFFILERPRPPLPDRPAPRGLRRPGKPDPRPCGGRKRGKEEKGIRAKRGTTSAGTGE